MADHLVLDRVRITRPDGPAFSGAVVVAGDRLHWIGSGIPPTVGSSVVTQRIDFGGAFLFPGFVDAHCHPLALGVALTAADCSPSAASSIAGIQLAITRWASAHPEAPWVRGFGYDEILLRDRRHPSRHDLDAAVVDRPVMLTHGSGHALVLNTAGLRAAGITESTDEPTGGYIDRDPSTGIPTGLLFEMARYVAERTEPRTSDAMLTRYASAASDAFVRAGVTAVVDADPSGDQSTLQTWAKLRCADVFRPAVTVMRSHRARIPKSVIADCAGWATPGHAKIMLVVSGGRLAPDAEALVEIVEECLAEGSGVAVHAVEAEAVLAVCRAFERAGKGRPPDQIRIEHAAETPPEVCSAIRRSGASVTTQPGFIFRRGDRYLAGVRTGACATDHLYAVRSLLEQGVHVRGSSDAPYGPVSPLDAIHAAVVRASSSGNPVGPSQAVRATQSLGLYFGDTGSGSGDAMWKDLHPGARADLVLLSDDPRSAPAEHIRNIEVIATIVAGQVVWRA